MIYWPDLDSSEEQMIRAWSHSRLIVFEQCKLRTKLAVVDKIPEPERPLPAGKTEHANDRGSRVHEHAELFITSAVPVEQIPEMRLFREEFDALRELYLQRRVQVEGEWAMNRDWMPVGWNSLDAWVRMKLDACVQLTDSHALVIDFKTGRRAGNEFKHAEQGQLYQLATFLRYPDLEKIDVELWYLDQDELVRYTYTRKQGMKFLESFTNRGMKYTTEEDFAPNPNRFSCRYCPYGPKGTGHCTVGIQ